MEVGVIDDDELDNLLAGTGDLTLSQQLSSSRNWGSSGAGADSGASGGGGGESSRSSARMEAVKDDLFDL